jgi:hypothetical protein
MVTPDFIIFLVIICPKVIQTLERMITRGVKKKHEERKRKGTNFECVKDTSFFLTKPV